MESLLRRWSFWHTAMVLISLSFFMEIALTLGDLYWWKLTNMPASLQGLISVEECATGRERALTMHGFKVILRLFKYVWYAALLGFGWLEWSWIKLSQMSIFKSLNEKGRGAMVGSIFLGALLILNNTFFLAAQWIAKAMTIWNEFSADDLIGSIDGFMTGVGMGAEAFVLCYFSGMWEGRLGYKLYLALPVVHVLYILAMNAYRIIQIRMGSAVIGTVTDFPAAEAIISLCQQVGFNPNHVYVVPNDAKNALMTGIGPLASILIYAGFKSLKAEEMLAVVAHELGHWQHSHMPLLALQNFFWSSLTVGLFYLFRQRSWYQSVMPKSAVQKPLDFPFSLSLVIFHICLTPFRIFLINSLSHMISWLCEMAADRFAVNLGYAHSLMTSLVDMSRGAMHVVVVSPIYGLFYSSHPPLNVRFSFIKGGDMFQ